MFTTAAAIQEYALAGHATLTLTGKTRHYTFKINQAKDRETGELQSRWFVALLSGPNNETDYQYLGMVEPLPGSTVHTTFRRTSGSKFAADSIPMRAFNFFWRYIGYGQMPPDMDIQHSGHCGRCGRKLTHPESLANGIGPECASKMAGG